LVETSEQVMLPSVEMMEAQLDKRCLKLEGRKASFYRVKQQKMSLDILSMYFRKVSNKKMFSLLVLQLKVPRDQHDDTQYKVTQDDDPQHNNIIGILSMTKFSITIKM
jgi:hypothetical protein